MWWYLIYILFFFFRSLQGYDASGLAYEKDYDKDEEYSPLWFVMDEFGSCIRHSDDPTFGMSFMSYVPLGIFFSIIWPLKDLEYGGLFQANKKRRTSHVMNVMLISKNNRFCSLSSFMFITCEVWCLTCCSFLKTPKEFSGLRVFFFSSIFYDPWECCAK